jgi:hypothetical protein
MPTPVLDRPRESLDDLGLPPLPPDVDPGGEPLPPGGSDGPRVWRLIAWNVALVVSVPVMSLIVKMISHAG